MATYSLSGSGTQLLTATTTALHVTLTALNPEGGDGNANPLNHYHEALIRFGDGTGWWAPVPVEGGPSWIGLPNGCDRIGYACQGGATMDVAEVIGGTSPFAGPAGAAGSPGAPGASGSFLGYASAVLGSPITMTVATTFYDILSLTLAAGTWIIWTRWQAYNAGYAGAHSFDYRLTDGSTVYSGGASTENSNGFIADCSHVGVVTLSGTTTVKLQVRDTSQGGTNITSQATSGIPGNTQMVAVQVA